MVENGRTERAQETERARTTERVRAAEQTRTAERAQTAERATARAQAGLTLDRARMGGAYRVSGIALDTAVEKRLEALGMTHGAKVEVLNRKGKGTVIVRIRGSRFALGSGIAAGISLDEEGAGSPENAGIPREAARGRGDALSGTARPRPELQEVAR